MVQLFGTVIGSMVSGVHTVVTAGARKTGQYDGSTAEKTASGTKIQILSVHVNMLRQHQPLLYQPLQRQLPLFLQRHLLLLLLLPLLFQTFVPIPCLMDSSTQNVTAGLLLRVVTRVTADVITHTGHFTALTKDTGITKKQHACVTEHQRQQQVLLSLRHQPAPSRLFHTFVPIPFLMDILTANVTVDHTLFVVLYVMMAAFLTLLH